MHIFPLIFVVSELSHMQDRMLLEYMEPGIFPALKFQNNISMSKFKLEISIIIICDTN